MKYIKSHKLFESVSDEIFDTVGDILLDINDNEFGFSTKKVNYYPTASDKRNAIEIRIEDEDGRFFALVELKDIIQRLYNYISYEELNIVLNCEEDGDYYNIDDFKIKYRYDELYFIEIIIFENKSDLNS